jgi:2-iminobutanoate/2-iminopropanoate deaminase
MKQIIHTPHAPSPIGPYSQAVRAGSFLFISGQIGMNPKSGELEMSSIELETHQVMRNLQAILTAENMTFGHVVKATIYLKNMNEFAQMNAVYGEYFEENYPARETVQVSCLPKDVNVEISVVAYNA